MGSHRCQAGGIVASVASGRLSSPPPLRSAAHRLDNSRRRSVLPVSKRSKQGDEDISAAIFDSMDVTCVYKHTHTHKRFVHT